MAFITKKSSLRVNTIPKNFRKRYELTKSINKLLKQGKVDIIHGKEARATLDLDDGHITIVCN